MDTDASRGPQVGDEIEIMLKIIEEVFLEHRFPYLASCLLAQHLWRARVDALSIVDDGQPVTAASDILNYVSLENDDAILALTGQQVAETDAFDRIESGGRLIDDHDLRRVQ